MLYSVDRILGGIAVLVEDETGKIDEQPMAKLPQGTKEGDMLRREPGGVFKPAPEETEKRRQRVKGLLDTLLNRPE